MSFFRNVFCLNVYFLFVNFSWSTLIEPTVQVNSLNPDLINLEWPVSAGQIYSVLGGESLQTPSPLSSGLIATPPDNTWWFDRQGLSRAFFQVLEQVSFNEREQLVNGEFVSVLEPWVTSVIDAAGATFTPKSSGLLVDITMPGTAKWHIQLIQPGFRLEAGQQYKLSFEARSVGAPRSIDLKIQSTLNPSQNTYFSQSVDLTPTRKLFVYNFVPERTDSSARIGFSFGGNETNLTIDKVSLLKGLIIQKRAESHEMVRRMGGGNNLMAAKVILGHAAIDDFKLLRASGYSHCRIGYKMDERSGEGPDYLLPEKDLRLLREAVHQCLKVGLIAVVDPVHNWANGPGYTHPDDLPKLRAIWRQVALLLAAEPLSSVVFEIINEPHEDDNVVEIIEGALSEIRSITGNESRQVIVSGEGFSTRGALISAFEQDLFPTQDNNLIATFHYYHPFSFTKQGKVGADPPSPTNWGSVEDIDTLRSYFDEVVAANDEWAIRNGTDPLPVYLGEFGVDNAAPPTDRKRWLAMVRMEAEARDFSWAHWNMYGDGSSHKGMGPWTSTQVQDPSSRSFQPETVEAMTVRYQSEDGLLVGGVASASLSPGFTGSGYLLYSKANGDDVYSEHEVYIPSDDNYLVNLRYTCPTACELTLIAFDLDGTEISRSQAKFQPSGGWSHWKTRTVDLSFRAGESVRLRLVAGDQPGPALDQIHISR